MAEVLRLDSELVKSKEPIIGICLAMLGDCRSTTMDVLKNLRFDLLYWRRNEFDSNISDLLYHIAYIEAEWLYTDVLQESIPDELKHHLVYQDRDSHGRLVHIGEEELESSLLRLDKVRKKLNDTYSRMDIAEFQRLRHSEKHDVTAEWVLYYLTQHEAEHRGQINLLKRLGNETKTKKSS
jgi:uncharacterized damage-inducible protein DinB